MELPVVPLAGRPGPLQADRIAEMKWCLHDKVMGGYHVNFADGDSYELVLFATKEDAEAYVVGHALNNPRMAGYEAVLESSLPFEMKRSWKRDE